MKIGIVGIGVVGNAHRFGFQKLGHDVSFHDTAHDTKLEDDNRSILFNVFINDTTFRDGSISV